MVGIIFNSSPTSDAVELVGGLFCHPNCTLGHGLLVGEIVDTMCLTCSADIENGGDDHDAPHAGADSGFGGHSGAAVRVSGKCEVVFEPWVVASLRKGNFSLPSVLPGAMTFGLRAARESVSEVGSGHSTRGEHRDRSP